jgi:hypothetical protein
MCAIFIFAEHGLQKSGLKEKINIDHLKNKKLSSLDLIDVTLQETHIPPEISGWECFTSVSSQQQTQNSSSEDSLSQHM